MIYKILLPILIVALLVVVWIGGGDDFVKGKLADITGKPTSAILTPSPTSTTTPTIVPTAIPSKVPAGWQTYTNSQYGFTISYPSDYKVLTDKDNLYGWPNGIALIYGGGQAYDVVIEVWTTEDGYKATHPGETLTVYKAGSKFITVSDQTKNAETEEIISTFSLNSTP